MLCSHCTSACAIHTLHTHAHTLLTLQSVYMLYTHYIYMHTCCAHCKNTHMYTCCAHAAEVHMCYIYNTYYTHMLCSLYKCTFILYTHVQCCAHTHTTYTYVLYLNYAHTHTNTYYTHEPTLYMHTHIVSQRELEHSCCLWTECFLGEVHSMASLVPTASEDLAPSLPRPLDPHLDTGVT